MSNYLPVGLSYLLQNGGAEISFNPTDIISNSGKIGPLVFRFTNKDVTTTAVVGYDNNLNPEPTPPLEYEVVTTPNTVDRGPIGIKVAIEPGVSATFLYELDGWNSTYAEVGDQHVISGSFIGGSSPLNNLIFQITSVVIGVDQYDNPTYTVTGMDYISGTIPTTTINTSLPTAGSPSKVIILPPGVTEYVQIPTSNNGLTTMKADGADVYVTPVQLI